MSTRDFFDAIREGDQHDVERLLRGTPNLIHEKEDRISPVLMAAYHHQRYIADFLAEKTVVLNIFEAAATGKTAQIVRLLARDPELVNAYAEDGFQPLGLACFFGQLETAEYLIKAGARVNSASKNEMHAAPLHSAAAGRHTALVKLLLKHDADPNARQQGGVTPLHAAVQNGDLESIRALLFQGADADAKTDKGRSALDFAREGREPAVLALLKEKITKRFRR